jgi:uncharacterized protein
MEHTLDIKYHILSVDGGGIRGLAVALVIEEIEKRMGRPAN